MAIKYKTQFKRATKIDVKEEWVTDEDTGVELLVTNEFAKRFDIATALIGDDTELFNIAIKDVSADQQLAIHRRIESVGYYLIKDWRGEQVDGIEYDAEVFKEMLLESGAINMLFTAMQKFGEMQTGVTKKVATTKGKSAKA